MGLNMKKRQMPQAWHTEKANTCFSKCYQGEGSYYCPACESNEGSVWLLSDWRPTKWQALCADCRKTFTAASLRKPKSPNCAVNRHCNE